MITSLLICVMVTTVGVCYWSQYKPQFIFAVPRLFETIYRGVMNKFATESALKKKLIAFFTATSMTHVKLLRTARGLVIRDRPPSPVTRVGRWVDGSR